MPGDRYHVRSTLGRGGMGEVVQAVDLHLGREVAIKRLYDHATPRALARFLREARIQGQLEHPAIPPVYELGFDTAGRPYFAMLKVRGTTLAEILRDAARTARHPRPRLLRAFVGVCRAVELAHSRGIVHRDLKPSNILLGEHGEVYLIDWGIARCDDDPSDAAEPAVDTGGRVTEAGVAVGTPGYMAPEQALGQPNIDARADVYALGCVLFEILAGQPLHPPGRAGMKSAIDGADGRPSSRGADVPPELDELCRRATATERDARLGSVRKLADAVERFLEGDRDLALRQRLAGEHLARARHALAGGGHGEQARSRAMREAGRALALVPESAEAAALVGSLVIAPPAIPPRSVRVELAALDRVTARRHAWFALAAHAGYLALTAVLYAIGVRDPVYLGTFAGIAALGIAIGRRELARPSRVMMVAQLAANVAIIALLARMFTPFLVAPGVAAVAVMAFAAHPAGARRGLLAATCAVSAAAIVALYIAEAAGIIAPTMEARAGTILLHSRVDGIASLPVGVALCAYAIALLAAAAVVSGRIARAHRAAREHVHIQTWHLRQLVALRTCDPA